MQRIPIKVATVQLIIEVKMLLLLYTNQFTVFGIRPTCINLILVLTMSDSFLIKLATAVPMANERNFLVCRNIFCDSPLRSGYFLVELMQSV